MSFSPKQYPLITVLSLESILRVAHIQELLIITPDGRNYKIYQRVSRTRAMAEGQAVCQHCGTKGLFVELRSDPNNPVPRFRHILAIRSAENRLMTIDHIFPKSKGGKTEASNLQVLCSPCNTAKKDTVPPEMAEWLLHRTVDPEGAILIEGSNPSLGTNDRQVLTLDR